MMNKRAWIKIIEAFVAILLVTGFLLVVINQEYVEKVDISSKVYKTQISILREIAEDDILRNDILNAVLPMNWNNESFPASIKNKISERIPNYLNCEINICEIDDSCDLDRDLNKEIYVQSITISSNLEIYSPRKLKMFCWAK